MFRFCVKFVLFVSLPAIAQPTLFTYSFHEIDSTLIHGEFGNTVELIKKDIKQLSKTSNAIEQEFYSKAFEKYLLLIKQIKRVDRLQKDKIRQQMQTIFASDDLFIEYGYSTLDIPAKKMIVNYNNSRYKTAYRYFWIFNFFRNKYNPELNLLLDRAKKELYKGHPERCDSILYHANIKYIKSLPSRIIHNDAIIKFDEIQHALEITYEKRKTKMALSTKTRYRNRFSLNTGVSLNKVDAFDFRHSSPYQGENPNFTSKMTYSSDVPQIYYPGLNLGLQYNLFHNVVFGLDVGRFLVYHEKIFYDVRQDFFDNQAPPYYSYSFHLSDLQINGSFFRMYLLYRFRNKTGLRPFIGAGVEQLYLTTQSHHDQISYFRWIYDHVNIKQKRLQDIRFSLGLEYVPRADSRFSYTGSVSVIKHDENLIYLKPILWTFDFKISYYLF